MIRYEKIVSKTTGELLYRWFCDTCSRTSVALLSQEKSERNARLHIEWHRDDARAELAAMPPAPPTELVPVESRRIRASDDTAGETRDRYVAVFGEGFLTEIAK
jgi:hypothetical protein